jgi:hypothetical protein
MDYSPKFVGMFINYIYAKFHVHSTNSPIVITVKLKAKWKFCIAAMLSFYILKKIP